MPVDQRLVDAASRQLRDRYGDEGWGGAAAMYTRSGAILTSVAVDALNTAACLCIETGAIAEAHRRDDSVLASACVVRDADSPDIRVLPSCGICLERLRYWGPDVEVAVPDGDTWRGVTLRELQPHWWGNSYTPSLSEH